MTGLEANRAAFQNAAQAQGFGQNQARASFGNTARQQEYANSVGATGINNAARQQMYDNRTGATSFNNSAAQQEFGNQMTSAGFNNEWKRAGFGNQRALRSDYLNEAYALRNQPLNEIGALLSGSQVQGPQFVNTPQTSVGGVDYTGLVNQQYQSKLANSQAKMGGLFGLLSAPFAMFG